MLAARDVSLSVEDTPVLRDVDFALRPAEMLAVIGPNGAGKSSIARVLAGEIEPTQGKITMNEEPLAEWSLLERARTRAVLPQHSTLQFAFRVLDVVLMGRSPHSKTAFTSEDMNIVRAVLTCTDVPHLEHGLFPSLSGGERQRVQLARVLAQIWDTDTENRRYLLLDEPTSALDLSHQHSTLWIARQLADEKGVGVLVVLHDLNLAALYADRIAIMQDGQLKCLGHPAEVLQAHFLAEVFKIPVTISPHSVRQDRPLVVTSPAIHQLSIFSGQPLRHGVNHAE